MLAVTYVGEKKENEHNIRYFTLCESCFWSMTLIRKVPEFNASTCPLCFSENVSLIPLADDESYNLAYSAKRGLEISFSKGKLASKLKEAKIYGAR